MKAVSKEMRKRQKHFPWLKTFLKDFLKTYPSCKKTFHYLIENIEKEVKELAKGHQEKCKALFETVNDLYLHFWWKIRWKNLSNVEDTHSYHCSKIPKSFGKLLTFLIHLGVVLSQETSDSSWINRVLQAINILPVNDEIIYDALLQNSLKKRYRSQYMEILRHKLCSEIIVNISKPAVYVKVLMLLRRLKNYAEDKVSKASIVSIASKIQHPTNFSSWLSSLEISVNANKSIVDQLFEKNSKPVFQQLYDVLMDSKSSGSSKKEKNSKSHKKYNSHEAEEENLLGLIVDRVDSPNKDIVQNVQPFENINIQDKKLLLLPELCEKIKKVNKKKKHVERKKNVNLVNSESNTKSKQQPKNTITDKIVEETLDSQNISTKHRKSKKNKKSKAKNVADVTATTKNNNIESKKEKSGSKVNKSKKRKKSEDLDNAVHDKKSDLLNSETNSNEANSFDNEDSVLVQSKFHTRENSQAFEDVNDTSLLENNLMINKEKNSKDDKNCATKKVKLSHSVAENQIFQSDEVKKMACVKSSNDKASKGNDLGCKLPNLLANYEIYSSEENEAAKRDVSSCLLVESSDNVLVPDTCQNDMNCIVPFNLDSWVPKSDTSRDTSFSNDGSQISNKTPTDLKMASAYQNSRSDFSSFNDSAFEHVNESEVSRDTDVSNDGSQISNKNPFVSLVDIKKMKKLNFYQKSDNSNSSFDSCYVWNIDGSEVSLDGFVSNEESRISGKDSNCFKKADNHYDPILGEVTSKKVVDVSNQIPDKWSCFGLHGSENRNGGKQNLLGENHHGGNKNNDSELSPQGSNVESKPCQENQSPSKKRSKARTALLEQDILSKPRQENQSPDKKPSQPRTPSSEQDMQSKPCQENQSPGKKPSKARTPSSEQDMQSKPCQENQSPSKKPSKARTASLEQDILSKPCQENQSPSKKPSKARTSLEEDLQINKNLKTNLSSSMNKKRPQTISNVRKKQKRIHNSDKSKNYIQLKEGDHQDFETTPEDVNSDIFLNDLSTLLPNHGDLETQENEVLSSSAKIPPNLSDTRNLSQFQEYKIHEESNVLHNGSNEKQPPFHIFSANSEKQSCVSLPSENHPNNVSICSIDTVLDEFIDFELSRTCGSRSSLNSVRLSDNVTENAHAGSIHNVDENVNSPFQTQSDFVPSDCFSLESNFNTPQQNRSTENDVSQSMLNLGANENPPRNALSTNPAHRNDNTNLVNTNFNSCNRNFVIDCNINDFVSRNSSQAGSADTPRINVILNLINTKPENSSNSQNPNFSGNSYLQTAGAPQSVCYSIPPLQAVNRPNGSLPIHRDSSSFGEPPVLTRSVVELVTPPDSERHLRILNNPRNQNIASSCSENRTNLAPPKINVGSSTPKSLRRNRQRSTFSASSDSGHECKIYLNSSLSNIPRLQTMHCRDAPSTLNARKKVNNNHSAKGNRSKDSVSRTGEHSVSVSEKTPRQKISYRNSGPIIYSEESEEGSSVSSVILLSDEETDHSLMKDPNETSPIIHVHRKSNSPPKSKTKKLFREEKWALDPPTFKPRAARKSKPLTNGNQKSVVKKGKSSKAPIKHDNTAAEKSKPLKKGRPKVSVKKIKSPETSIKREYNLRSRNSLLAPPKLNLYYCVDKKYLC